MLSAFKTSFKLKITYRVNSIIYSLKQIPIIKKLLPAELYKSKGLKTFATILSALGEIIGIFLGKFLYLFLMIGLPLALYKGNSGDIFVHIFTLLTISGAIMNSHMFNPTKDKFYAIFLMRMDARSYTLSNYYYFLLKNLVGFMPVLIIVGAMEGLLPWIGIMLAFFVVFAKMINNALVLLWVKKNEKIYSENKLSPLRWIIVLLLLGGAYGLPILGVVFKGTMFIVLFTVSLIGAVPGFFYIHKYGDYKKIYKKLLSKEEIIFDVNAFVNESSKTNFEKQIDTTQVKAINKKGYGYLNEIFVQRHRKILTRSAKNTALVLTVILAATIGAVIYSDKFSLATNRITLTYLPYFLFIMYMINKGQVVTQAMFMNCDHSMLTYRFYRQPKAILELFTKRLVTLIKINLIPAMVLAIGLPALLFISGGTDNPLNYVVLFLSIIFMSIFFSVHYLVLYYLLQPYNVNLEVKNFTYSMITSGTYFVAFLAMKVKLPTLAFGGCIILFTVLYVVIALGLTYKYAPKTFKLR